MPDPFETQEVQFLDGPWKGPHQIMMPAVTVGHTLHMPGSGPSYRIQWNSDLFRWEAITIGEDNAE